MIALRIWDIDTGDCLQVLIGHNGSINCFDIHDKIVVSGSSDFTVRVWEIETGQEIHVLGVDEVKDEISSIQISPEADQVIAGGFDSTVRIWNYNTGKNVDVLQGHTDWVYSLLVYEHPNMNTELVNSGSRIEEKDSSKKDVALPITLFSGCWDSTVKIWDRKERVKRGKRKHGKTFKILNRKGKQQRKNDK